MNRKVSAILASGLMILSAVAALAGAAGTTPAPGTLHPAPGPRGSTPNNDSEPNNDMGNATEITGSASFGGKIGQGDFDYFKISLATGATADTLTVSFKAHTGGGTRLAIYDPNRFEILYEEGTDLQLTFTAYLSGYYFIYLPERGPCDYTLTTVKGTAAFITDGDNAPAQATAIFPSSSVPFTTIGIANNISDMSDFFKVRLNYSELLPTDVLKAFIDPPATGAFSVLLYESGQAEPQAGYVLANPDQNQTLTYSPTAPGDFYLRVWAHHGSGQYSLKVSLFTGMADNNGMKEFAGALDPAPPALHWSNTTGDLTLGIDPDDFFRISNVVAGQVFNCTVTSTGYDAQDGTPDITIRLHDDLNELPPSPVDNLADPTAYANTRVAEGGNFFIQLNLTQWAGPYDLAVFTNSPPQLVSSVPNVTFIENTTDQSIKLVNVFSDPEEDPLAYQVVPYIDGWQDNLTFTVGNDPFRTLTIAPRSGWHGVFSMDLVATDPYGETATASVQQVWVQGINHKPEIINSNVGPIVLEKNKPDLDQLNLTTVFRDPDAGDRLFYNVTGNESIRVTFPKEVQNQYYHTGAVTFLPSPGFIGTELMYFTASDERGLVSDPVMVTVEVRQNITEKLTVTAPPRLVMDEDSPGVTINLASNVSSNLPDDTFTFEHLPAAGSNLTVKLTGTLVNITPAPGFYGVEVLTFNVTCSHGQKGVLELTVETLWVNEYPVITPLSPSNWTFSVSEGETVLFKINVSDRETLQSQLKGRWLNNGAAAGTGLEYSFATGYDTVTTAQGSKLFVVRVTVNDSLAISSMSWNVTVNNVNRAPTPSEVRITFPPEGSEFEEGAKIHFIGLGADQDGDALTFQWYEGTRLLGTGAELNVSSLKAGKHNITLKVSDATSSTNYYLNIKVKPKPTPGFEAVFVVAALAVAAVAAVLLARRRG